MSTIFDRRWQYTGYFIEILMRNIVYLCIRRIWPALLCTCCTLRLYMFYIPTKNNVHSRKAANKIGLICMHFKALLCFFQSFIFSFSVFVFAFVMSFRSNFSCLCVLSIDRTFFFFTLFATIPDQTEKCSFFHRQRSKLTFTC